MRARVCGENEEFLKISQFAALLANFNTLAPVLPVIPGNKFPRALAGAVELFAHVTAGSQTALSARGAEQVRQRRPAVEVMDDNYHEGDSRALSKINCADSDRCDPLAIVHYCTRL